MKLRIALSLCCLAIIGAAVGSESQGLYTDGEIRARFSTEIDHMIEFDDDVLRVPALDVVPSGESRPRGEVFEKLALEERRLGEFRDNRSNFVVFLFWQISPSYEICCMSASNDRRNAELSLTDPRRRVYGIRIVKRQKAGGESEANKPAEPTALAPAEIESRARNLSLAARLAHG